MKVIDSKGRILGKINIVDLAILLVIFLTAFVAVKYIFFPRNYFHYEDYLVQVNYTKVDYESLESLSIGKNYLLGDNNSYIILPKEKVVKCYHKISSNSLFDYIDSVKSSSIDKEISSCSYNKYISFFTLGTNISQVSEKENWVNCISNNKKIIMFDDPFTEPEDFFCDITLSLKLRTRIIDGEPFYKEYRHYISEGGYLDIKADNLELYEGKVTLAVKYEAEK